jgi:uncharacterized membrane protein YhhN
MRRQGAHCYEQRHLGGIPTSISHVGFAGRLIKFDASVHVVIKENTFDNTSPHQSNSRLVIVLIALAAASGAIEIAGQYFGSRTIVYIFKPLTMVFIIGVALLGVSDLKSYRNLILAALCCSLAGDVFLMLPSDQFVPGLLSFLLAHLFYIAAFRTQPSGMLSTWFGVACVAYGGLMLWLLFPYLGEMKLPVLIYLVVVLVMAWQALCRWAASRNRRALLAALGAVLFVVSDSMIAINRFYGRFSLADVLIMATYFAAQWLIAMSVART